ncbi:hypothetical protein [Saccharothrix variisporea]|uniref:Excreted virulence factor EspC (Type VII ESX diderm) n=1 Tax=Saccharothrix variisporea TaxID=543527 RepID=A0A495X034_9PSEU|nr:hypothetical protein [Saccharothrix variisporea]RKT67177.1 hypothetical protein DFJ66_0345 [Saccharothrix variisporea]
MGFDYNRDGAVDMDIDATARELGQLRATGENFGREWAALKTTIQDLAGRLGGGPMGREFKASYDTWAAALGQYADDVVKGYRELADAGDGCVRKYRDADAAAARLYKS